MKFYVAILISFFCLKSISQNDALARQYFDEGAFDKAVLYYEKLYQTNPQRTDYLQYLTVCYQQLERYKDAENVLLSRLKEDDDNIPTLYIELGYTYLLQNDQRKANEYYDIAVQKISENPSYAYAIGETFRKKGILNYAITAFKKGLELNPEPNFNLNYGLASTYGEMGDIEAMYNAYLALLAQRENVTEIIKRRFGDFISENPENESNMLLKKVLLKKIQNDSNIIWNELLSWLFIQQKHYKNAFIQEKAIYKRSEAPSLENIMELGVIAMEDNDNEAATEIFTFVIENPVNTAIKMEAQRYLLQMEIEAASEKEYQKIEEKLTSLLNHYGYTANTIALQTMYADFLTFKRNQSPKAIRLLEEALTLPLSVMEQADTKMALAAILVYEEKFNQALIYYAQVQKLLKNDVLAQTARFKTAQTSFYKGDFKWAETQLNVLKSSTSQLIANDALQLKLLIADNAAEDSTQTALKLYAKADLLAYQNNNDDAIALLETLLTQHKGKAIEDEALLKQAQLLEKKKSFDSAKNNYLKIITFYPYDTLADDALFALAELYNNHLNDPEKAKTYYEKIIFDHPDSVYFVEARKKYRGLRGDAIN